LRNILIYKIPQSYRDRILKVADFIFKYIHETESNTKNYFNTAPKDSIKDFMIFVDKYVPQELKSYCRDMYYGKDINYIKSSANTKCPRYKKLKEMGIENYSELFRS